MPVDPYSQILDMPAGQRPANHYEWLGLSVFESDPAVIAAAAQARYAHVRKYQAGAHSEAVVEFLNQIAAASECLKDPVRKKVYDADLRGLSTKADAELNTTVVDVTPARCGAAGKHKTAGRRLAPVPAVVLRFSCAAAQGSAGEEGWGGKFKPRCAEVGNAGAEVGSPTAGS